MNKLIFFSLFTLLAFYVEAQDNLLKDYKLERNSSLLNEICINQIQRIDGIQISSVLESQSSRLKNSYDNEFKTSKARLESVSNGVAVKNATMGTVSEIVKIKNKVLTDMVKSYTKNPTARAVIMTYENTMNKLMDVGYEYVKKNGNSKIEGVIKKEVAYIVSIAKKKNKSDELSSIETAEQLSKFTEELGIENENLAATNNFLNKEAFKLIKGNTENLLKTKEDIAAYAADREQRFKEFEDEVSTNIKDFQLAVVEAQDRTFKTISKLKKDVEDNANNIAENSFKIDALNAFYNFDKSSLEKKIKQLENGDMNKFIQKQNREALISELKELKNDQDIITTATTISQVTEVTSQAIEAFGILKGKDAEKANEALTILGGAATAVAQFYTGDYIGMVSSVISIFGSGKPKKSAEMQMLEQIYKKLEVMDQKLDYVIDVVESIDEKLIQIGTMIETLHKDMLKGFEASFDEFDKLNRQLEQINRLLYAEASKGFVNCGNLENYEFVLNEYDDLREFFQLNTSGDCEKCFGAINEILGINILQLQGEKNGILQPHPLLELQYNGDENAGILDDIYTPLRELMDFYINSNTRQMAYQDLLYPVNYVQDNSSLIGTLSYLKREGNKNVIDVLNASNLELGELLNANAVVIIGDLYMKYYPFFEADNGGASKFEPMEFERFVKSSNIGRVRNHKKRIGNMLNALDNSIIQQSLISGHGLEEALYVLLDRYDVNHSQSPNCLKILNNNYFVQQNFAITRIHNDFSQRESVYNLWINDDSKRKLELFNNKISISKQENGKISFEFTYQREKSIIINDIDWERILTGQKLYPSVLVDLKTLKEKFLAMLVDIEYREEIHQGTDDNKLFFRNMMLSSMANDYANF